MGTSLTLHHSSMRWFLANPPGCRISWENKNFGPKFRGTSRCFFLQNVFILLCIQQQLQDFQILHTVAKLRLFIYLFILRILLEGVWSDFSLWFLFSFFSWPVMLSVFTSSFGTAFSFFLGGGIPTKDHWTFVIGFFCLFYNCL